MTKKGSNNGGGAKRKWDLLNMPSKLEAITGWAKQGYVDREIMEMLGISHNTFYTWKKVHPEFDEALKKGKHVANGELVNAAFRNATGYYIKVTEPVKVRDKFGAETVEMVTYDKYIPANSTQSIFMLKNRLPEHYRDKQEVKHEGEIAVTFVDDVAEDDIE